jgi:hypothetical protein
MSSEKGNDVHGQITDTLNHFSSIAPLWEWDEFLMQQRLQHKYMQADMKIYVNNKVKLI